MEDNRAKEDIADRISAMLDRWQRIRITDERLEILYKEVEEIITDVEKEQ